MHLSRSMHARTHDHTEMNTEVLMSEVKYYLAFPENSHVCEYEQWGGVTQSGHLFRVAGPRKGSCRNDNVQRGNMAQHVVHFSCERRMP